MFDWTVPAENTILTKIVDFIKIFCLTNIADTANNTILTEFINCKYPGQEPEKYGCFPLFSITVKKWALAPENFADF